MCDPIGSGSDDGAALHVGTHTGEAHQRWITGTAPGASQFLNIALKSELRQRQVTVTTYAD